MIYENGRLIDHDFYGDEFTVQKLGPSSIVNGRFDLRRITPSDSDIRTLALIDSMAEEMNEKMFATRNRMQGRV